METDLSANRGLGFDGAAGSKAAVSVPSNQGCKLSVFHQAFLGEKTGAKTPVKTSPCPSKSIPQGSEKASSQRHRGTSSKPRVAGLDASPAWGAAISGAWGTPRGCTAPGLHYREQHHLFDPASAVSTTHPAGRTQQQPSPVSNPFGQTF